MIKEGTVCIWQNIESDNPVAHLNGSECTCTEPLHYRKVRSASGESVGEKLVYGTDTIYMGDPLFAMAHHLREKRPPPDEFDQDVLKELEDKIHD